MPAKKLRKNAAGRPPKFAEASSPVTVTLPERILTLLRHIDMDRAKAIVKCAEAVAGTSLANKKQVETIQVFDGGRIIVIGPCASLARLPGLRLVEISPQRFLLVIMSGYSSHSLELDIMDIIEELAPEEKEERALLNALRYELSLHRRQDTLVSGEILLVGAQAA